MEYPTFMWLKARFDALDKRFDAQDKRLETLAHAIVSLVETLQMQGAAQMESVTRIESALADLKVREDALLARDSARDAAAAQAASDLAVAQAKVQAITEQLGSVSADRDTIKGQLDELNTHLASMADAAEAARDALPPVPVAVDPNPTPATGDAGNSAPASTDGSAASAAPSSTTSDSSAAPAGDSSATPSATDTSSAAPASDAASAPAATDTSAPTADAGQSAGDTSAVGAPTVVTETVTDGAAASNTPA